MGMWWYGLDYSDIGRYNFKHGNETFRLQAREKENYWAVKKLIASQEVLIQLVV